jgi:hypothetical protein
MVWLHGGSLSKMGGASPEYDGRRLAERGCQADTELPTGALGFLVSNLMVCLKLWSHGSTSCSALDTRQYQALWRSDNVTLFGESAGAVGRVYIS